MHFNPKNCKLKIGIEILERMELTVQINTLNLLNSKLMNS